MPLTKQADLLKVADRYKSEEVRFLTAEKKSLKVWTYDFRDFELYLDTKISLKKPVRSVSVCESQGLIAAVTSPGKTTLFGLNGEIIEKLKDKSFTAVGSSGENLLFGTEEGGLCTLNLQYMQQIRVYNFPKELACSAAIQEKAMHAMMERKVDFGHNPTKK